MPDFLDLTPRTEDVPLQVLFPKLDVTGAVSRFGHLASDSTEPDDVIASALRFLWREDGAGFTEVLQAYGFHEPENAVCYNGHCHQATPALGLVLKVLGFSHVDYLECYRINAREFGDSGIIVQAPPEEEPDDVMRPEFERIGRIPYCALEIGIDKDRYVVSAKHTKPCDDGSLISLLVPACHLTEPGQYPHPKDASRSALYLERISQDGRVLWLKQTPKDTEPEIFAEYLRMNLK